jgi:hypothetical protein
MDFNLKNDKLWFGLAFTLALAVRLLRLGEIPLSDSEAAWALQALNLSRGLPLDFGPQPGYINLTALVFFVLQASNFAARLLPALAGSALVLAPALFRDRLGGKAAIVLAFILAFEPGLLALSRMAGSPILAISLLILAWGAWRNYSVRLAGFLAGLALLAGSALWFGLLGLLLAFVLAYFLVPGTSFPLEKERLRPALYFAGGTYLVFGSLFLLAPGGLGAGLASLLDVFTRLSGWDGAPLWLPLSALFFYQFPALVLALVSLARLFKRRDPLVIFLGLWLTMSLLLAILPPSRQVADLGWALLPLWTLAALEVARWLEPPEQVVEFHPSADGQDAELQPLVISSGFWETLGMALLTVALIVFSWLNFSSAALVTFDPDAVRLRWILAFGVLALLALSVFLVAFGWSARAALKGFAWGGLTIFAINLLAMASFAAQLRPLPGIEMWPAAPQSLAIGVIDSQANEISQMARGSDAALNVMLVGVDSPALRWLLRDWRVTSAQALSFDSNPELIFTSENNILPELESAYRGAPFQLRNYPAWEQLTASEWLSWIINHDLPQGYELTLLWARSDLFPDSQNSLP